MQLQDKMRTLCIEEYNKEYNLDATLKQKMKGRNRDINVSDMTNYQETKELIEKHQKEINSISNNSFELKTDSNDIKEEINKLKKVPLRDDLFIISKEQKNKLEDYIDSANLNIITKQARQDSRKIKNLKESNDALQLRGDSLSEKVETQKNKSMNIEKIKKIFMLKLLVICMKIKLLVKNLLIELLVGIMI